MNVDADTLHVAKTWADVAWAVWRDVRGEVLFGLAGFVAGWLGLKRPRINKRTRSTDRGVKNGG